jgi:hypothetical protein
MAFIASLHLHPSWILAGAAVQVPALPAQPNQAASSDMHVADEECPCLAGHRSDPHHHHHSALNFLPAAKVLQAALGNQASTIFSSNLD